MPTPCPRFGSQSHELPAFPTGNARNPGGCPTSRGGVGDLPAKAGGNFRLKPATFPGKARSYRWQRGCSRRTTMQKSLSISLMAWLALICRRARTHRIRRRRRRSGPADRTEHRPARDHQVDVQLRCGLGHLRFREFSVQQSKNPGVQENLGDQWFEGYVKPALSGHHTFASGSDVYGKVSAVGKRRRFGPRRVRSRRVVVWT